MNMNTRDILVLFFLGCVLAISASCGGGGGSRSLELMDPVALDKNIVFIDKANDEAYFLEVMSKKPSARARTVALRSGPALVDKRKSSEVDELLVLCKGQEEQIDQAAEPANLVVLDGKGVARTYELTSRFDAMVQSDDGAIAILYFSETNSSAGGGDLSRRNEIAIVDLTKPAAKQGQLPNPVFRQLDNEEGSAPRAMVISPIISVVGIERRLAVALFASQVSLLDLSNLDEERKDIKIPFERLIATSPVIVSGAQSTGEKQTDEQPATIYLRSEQTDDVYIIDLVTTSGKSNDFWPNIKMRKSGGVSSDIALYQEILGEGANESEAARLLVVSEQGQKVTIIDPATGNVTDLALGFPANRALIFNAAAPLDTKSAPRALLYNNAGKSKTIGFLDLARIQERKAQNLETKDLGTAFSSLLSLNSKKPQVALVQQESSIKLLDLAERSVDPIQTGALASVVLDQKGKTLWLPSAPKSNDRVQLGYIHFDTGTTGHVLLDARIANVVLVGAGDETRVVVVHPSEIGYLTVLDGDLPTRDTAVTLQGFFLAGALD